MLNVTLAQGHRCVHWTWLWALIKVKLLMGSALEATIAGLSRLHCRSNPHPHGH